MEDALTFKKRVGLSATSKGRGRALWDLLKRTGRSLLVALGEKSRSAEVHRAAGFA
jgi:hypothetical protein